jgi:pyruvate ferredoxin oxidoreductase delta subunit
VGSRTYDVKYEIVYDYCKGCGICANECPAKAIEMVPEAP